MTCPVFYIITLFLTVVQHRSWTGKDGGNEMLGGGGSYCTSQEMGKRWRLGPRMQDLRKAQLQGLFIYS